jgi:hypothetical protein
MTEKSKVERRTKPLVPIPREHGFWVMSSAIVLSALARHPGLRTTLAALAVMALLIVAGGRARRWVRLHARFQLASAVLIAAAGLPIELAGGETLERALVNVAAWSSVFAAFALSVWAATARSSRVRRSHAGVLTLFSVLLPVAAATAFGLADSRAPALAAALASVSSSFFAIWRPGAKQMRPVGLSLTACAALAAIALTTA